MTQHDQPRRCRTLDAERWISACCKQRFKVQLLLSALDMALTVREPTEDLLYHSDRGSQYASGTAHKRPETAGITSSISRRGDCWDNAVVEGFFGTLKQGLVHRYDFEARSETKPAIFEYIEMFYNRRRRHLYFGYTSPVESEAAAVTAALAA